VAKFGIGDRVIIDMSRVAMNALNWNGQAGTIDEAHSSYPRNWWVKLDCGGRPNFREEEMNFANQKKIAVTRGGEMA